MLIFSALLVLTACNVESETAAEKNSEEAASEQSSSSVVPQNQLGEAFYRPALNQGGHYETSNSRGITLRLNSGLNIGLFEKDLLRHSQPLFSTAEYFIKEGQVLEADTISSWLGRASAVEDAAEEAESAGINKEGLNPPQSDNGERVPNYLNSILEFDFYHESELEAENPSGITIGLAMNTVDYYSDEEYRQFEQKIAPEVALEQGQRMANEIVSRMRTIEGLAEIPIMVGIYEQSAKDDLAGGVYVALGESLNGSATIETWETLNENRMIFPLEGGNSAEGNAFANFKSEVESFFPNLSGVTGRAHYIDDQLQRLTINIMTQFYGEQEIVSFTQYLTQAAATYLPLELDVEILVESPGNMEAFLKKDREETDYFSYVFD